MGSVLVSHKHTVGKAGAATWEVAIGSAGSVGVGSTGGSRMPWAREEGLARC